MYDVICVGSATIDVFARTKFSELIKIFDKNGETDLLAYPTGSKILIEELNFTTGGGATNTAVALARLGNKVACISKTGAGANAEKVEKHLERERVDTSLLVKDKNGRTGFSIILDSLEHDRTILAFKGSNNDLGFNEVNLKKLNTKWFYFSTMMDKSFKTLEKLAHYAQKNKIKIAFNISPYLAKKGAKYLEKILKRTEIFILNKEEASSIASGKTLEDLLKKVHKLGPKIVVITDGKNGATAYDGHFSYHALPHDVRIAETTGAGDAFASSFLSGMLKKNSIEFAMKLATINAESVITHHGAKTGLLKWNQALRFMKKCKTKIIKKKI